MKVRQLLPTVKIPILNDMKYTDSFIELVGSNLQWKKDIDLNAAGHNYHQEAMQSFKKSNQMSKRILAEIYNQKVGIPAKKLQQQLEEEAKREPESALVVVFEPRIRKTIEYDQQIQQDPTSVDIRRYYNDLKKLIEIKINFEKKLSETLSNIYFSTGSYELTKEGKEICKGFAEKINKKKKTIAEETSSLSNPGFVLTIRTIGYTDNTGFKPGVTSLARELIKDLACFVNEEYEKFGKKFPKAEEILNNYIIRHNDKIYIDLDKISKEQKKKLGEQAFNEIAKHSEDIEQLIPVEQIERNKFLNQRLSEFRARTVYNEIIGELSTLGITENPKFKIEATVEGKGTERPERVCEVSGVLTTSELQ